MEFVLALGDLVLGDEEEGLVVRGPSHLIHPLELVGQQLARAEVLDAERVLAVAGAVGRIGEQEVVIAGLEHAEAEEFVAFGQGVLVEDDFFPGLEAAVFATKDRIVLSLLRALVIEELAAANRRRGIRFLEVAQHFLVEPVAKRLLGAGDGLAVCVLGFEIGDDFGIGLFAEPEVIIHPLVAVRDGLLRHLSRRRRDGRLRRALD